MGQLEHGGLRLVLVSHEDVGKASFRIVGFAQHAHAQNVRIEVDRALHIADPDHRVKYAHLRAPQISTISKSSLRAPHSGHVQFIGTSSHLVPAAMPSSGAPAASS